MGVYNGEPIGSPLNGHTDRTGIFNSTCEMKTKN